MAGKILEALNLLRCQYENGGTTRIPAFSRVGSEEVDERDSQAWRNIAADPESKEIPASPNGALQTNKVLVYTGLI
jgi:hypothetical protein